MPTEIRTDDVCEVCKKKSLSVVNYTTSGSVILLLVECFRCGTSKTITRKMRERSNAKGMDIIPTTNTCSSGR